MAVSQHLLGVRPGYDGLVVDPQIGPDVPEFTVTRVARGATYEIAVVNSGVDGSRARLTVDGIEIEGNTVPYAAPGSVVQVTARLDRPGVLSRGRPVARLSHDVLERRFSTTTDRARPVKGPQRCATATSTMPPASTSSRGRTRRDRGSTTSVRGCTAGSSRRTPAATRSTVRAAPDGCCACGSTASRSTSPAATCTCAMTTARARSRRATTGPPPGSRSASRSTSTRRPSGTAWATRSSRPNTPGSARR